MSSGNTSKFSLYPVDHFVFMYREASLLRQPTAWTSLHIYQQAATAPLGIITILRSFVCMYIRIHDASNVGASSGLAARMMIRMGPEVFGAVEVRMYHTTYHIPHTTYVP